MTVETLKVKEKSIKGTGAAPLKNLTILNSLIYQVRDRAPHLPGIATFSGPSGFGKSTAAAFGVAHHGGYYVEIRSTSTKKSLLQDLLNAMGIQPIGTVNDMANQVADELAFSQRPIIIDEFDNIVARNYVEIIRDIYEMSKAPMILIGEELLPQKLQKWERFHGRVLNWEQAQPADINDARILNDHYCKEVTVANDLLMILVEQARGSLRRIVTNLELITKFARAEGLEKINKAQWGDRPLHMAIPPQARKKF